MAAGLPEYTISLQNYYLKFLYGELNAAFAEVGPKTRPVSLK